jgi:hypothetical protein
MNLIRFSYSFASLWAVCFLAFLGSTALGQDLSFPGSFPRPEFDALKALGMGDASIQKIALPEQTGEPITMVVWMDGGMRTIQANPYSVLSDQYKLMVQKPDGTYDQAAAPPSTTYRGAVAGYPDSMVAGSLFEGQFTAVIKLARDKPLWGLQPLSEFDPKAARSRYVVYSNGDKLHMDYTCGVTGQQLVDPVLDPTGGGGPGTAEDSASDVKIAEIACDADVEFYNKNGSSVTQTQNDITNIINAVEAIYEAEVGILYDITVIYVETVEPDPYGSVNPSTLLNQFKNHWNSAHGADQRDVAHLFTGKDLQGGVIGIAYVDVICNESQAYGVSDSKYTGSFTNRVGLTAHELGHNWNAVHCDGQPDCRIMCSCLGCCGPVTTFGDSAENAITAKKATVGCLGDAVPPDPPAISSISPDSVQVFLGGPVTIFGSSFETATQVDVGSATLAWPSGFTIVDGSTINLFPPQPPALGTYTVTVTNFSGTSNGMPLTYIETSPPKLAVLAFVVSGTPFKWNWGGSSGDFYYLLVTVDDNSTFSYQSFDILANFIIVDLGNLDALGLGSLDVTMPTGFTGSTVYSQIAIFDGTTTWFEYATNILPTLVLF